MNKSYKRTALAAAMAALLAAPAMADTAQTKGGITVKSDDGMFEAKVGGRIHYDGNFWVDDDDAPQTGSTFFRRARLTFSGKLYGWEYKFENDFAGQSGTTGSGLRDMYIATGFGPGKVYIGQFKAFRGMEEMTSSNELLMMERPTTTGVYANQFQLGLGYKGGTGNFGYGVFLQNLRSAADAATEGLSYGGRTHYAPVNTDTTAVHLGLSGSIDNPREGNTIGPGGIRTAGRLQSSGSRAQIGATGPGEEQTNAALELAARSGPFYVQGEYTVISLGQPSGTSDQDVTAYHVAASWVLTGEARPYDARNGVFKSPKPKGPRGAVELAARYEFVDNDDLGNEGNTTTLGVNYYVNPNVRFMVNYLMGETRPAGAPRIKLDNLTARAQISF